MPSPFPGMDPYLEDPEVFPDLHNSFNTYLQEALQPRLPPPYYASTGRRVWVEVTQRSVEPAVEVLRRSAAPSSAGGVALSPARTERAVVVRVPHDERTEPFLEIYAGRGQERRLVTSIEILSPTNKTPGEPGRDLYLRKQREILNSKVHLVEIDLLRGGEHTTAVPRILAEAVAGPF